MNESKIPPPNIREEFLVRTILLLMLANEFYSYHFGTRIVEDNTSAS